jgi:hypothetical protein
MRIGILFIGLLFLSCVVMKESSYQHLTTTYYNLGKTDQEEKNAVQIDDLKYTIDSLRHCYKMDSIKLDVIADQIINKILKNIESKKYLIHSFDDSINLNVADSLTSLKYKKQIDSLLYVPWRIYSW